MKILLTDDNKDARFILKKTLEIEGYTIKEAYNGISGLKVAGEFIPDMIISDVLMPEMDGFKFCMEIKKTPLLKEIPFIFYTAAYVDPKDEKLALALGAVKFIIKPVEMSEFLKIIRETFDEYRIKTPQTDEVHKNRRWDDNMSNMYEESVVRVLDKKVKDLTKANFIITEKMKNLDILNSIIKDVSSTIDFEDVLAKLAKHAINLVNGDAASIAILNGDKGVTIYPYNHHMYQYAQSITDKEDVNALLDINQHSNTKINRNGFKFLSTVPLTSKNKPLGSLTVFSKKRKKPFLEAEKKLLEAVGDEAAIAIENAGLYSELEQLFINTMTSFAVMLEGKSEWTKGHSERVTDLIIKIGESLGIDKAALETLKIAGLFHDIGKIATYDHILNKTERLTEEEMKIIQRHPIDSAHILMPIKQMKEVIPVVRYHHERIDGKGYPEGLKGDDIPLLSRIICVADSYDAIISDRPYRKSFTKEFALAELKKYSGTQFDSEIVKVFLKIFETN